MSNKIYWYWISKRKGIGNQTIGKLLPFFQNIEGIYKAKSVELEKTGLLTETQISILRKKDSIETLDKELEELNRQGICFVTCEEEAYPAKLKYIYNSPYFLYYRGGLPDENKLSIAIIGARKCSIYGREMAKNLAKELSKQGVIIVSGLASGIDGFAHQGALLGGEKTYGVVGNGVDVIYPKEHYALYQEVAKQGGIISEFPLGKEALPYHFPMRNRIISGLSDGILVIEAREKSGTLITVDCGLEQGKDIFALPGRVCDDLSMGCHWLLKNGAKLVTTYEDILEEYENKFRFKKNCSNHNANKSNCSMTVEENKVYKVLDSSPKHIDAIASECKLSSTHVLQLLLDLELKEQVMSVTGMTYIRKF